MSLLDEFSEEFCLMEKTRVPDGEGGFSVTWVEGAHFMMPMAHETTIEARVAENAGTASTYTFLPDKRLSFDYHDVFKRLRDGATFRVTSPTGDKNTPESSRLNRTYMTAERWVL